MRVARSLGALTGLTAVAALSVVVAAARAQIPAPSAQPSAEPTFAPSALPNDTPPPAPTPSPTPAYKFVYKPTPSPVTTPFPGPNAPEIQEIDLSDSSVTPPANIRARILTNPSVVSVTAETMGSELPIPRRSPGVFILEASIPDVPRFLRNRAFDVSFTATAPDGRIATVTLPLTIR